VTPAGVLLGSGELATELDRLELIDEYKFLVHPRIAGHGPTYTRPGCPALDVSSWSQRSRFATARSPCTTGARADADQLQRQRVVGVLLAAQTRRCLTAVYVSLRDEARLIARVGAISPASLRRERRGYSASSRHRSQADCRLTPRACQ
jgi:hypothetical protein